MLELYEQFNDISYFKYAEFLANSLVKFQRDDGSWPFRVNAKTGEVLKSNVFSNKEPELYEVITTQDPQD